MIIAHYEHRLPANYEIGQIRDRARTRGAVWNDEPELFFKAFLLRERGRHGAIANSYSSLYLWRQDAAFRDFLVGGRYGVVTDSFGRADIRTWFALDACRGSAAEPHFAYLEECRIPRDADLTASFAHEVERNRQISHEGGTAASAVGIDTRSWTFTRLRLSTDAPTAAQQGSVAYEILHLARPLLDTLPEDAGR